MAQKSQRNAYFQNLAAMLGILKACRLLRMVRIARDIDRYLAHTWATLVALVRIYNNNANTVILVFTGYQLVGYCFDDCRILFL